MRQTNGTGRRSSEKIVKDNKRATRKQYSSEEKIRIVLDGHGDAVLDEELSDPKSDCLVADSDPPLSRKILNNAKAQAEAEVQHTAYPMISVGKRWSLNPG